MPFAASHDLIFGVRVADGPQAAPRSVGPTPPCVLRHPRIPAQWAEHDCRDAAVRLPGDRAMQEQLPRMPEPNPAPATKHREKPELSRSGFFMPSIKTSNVDRRESLAYAWLSCKTVNLLNRCFAFMGSYGGTGPNSQMPCSKYRWCFRNPRGSYLILATTFNKRSVRSTRLPGSIGSANCASRSAIADFTRSVKCSVPSASMRATPSRSP